MNLNYRKTLKKCNIFKTNLSNQMKMVKSVFLTATISLLLVVCMITNAQTPTAEKNTTTGTVKYQNKTYTISIGAISKNEDGNTTVELLGKEIGIVSYSGNELAAPFTPKVPIAMKIVTGGKTIAWDGVIMDTDVFVFSFKTMETPDKIIVYGNDGNTDNPVVTFDAKTKTAKTAPVVIKNPEVSAPPVEEKKTQPETTSAPVNGKNAQNEVKNPSEEQKAQPVATKSEETKILPEEQSQPITFAQLDGNKPQNGNRPQNEVKKVQSTETYAQPDVKKNQPLAGTRKWFLDAGLSVYVHIPSEGDAETYVGGALGIALYVTPQSFLLFEFGAYYSESEIGQFSYIEKYSNGTSKTFYDGIITREISTVPILLSWNYVFSPAEKFHFRIGPILGSTVFTASDIYTPEVDNAPSPNEVSKSVFSYGAGIGFTWDFAKRWFLDGGYRLLGNTAASFENKEIKGIGNQINFTIGWRFGKSIQ